MHNSILMFAIGLTVGCSFGFVVAAICQMSSGKRYHPE